MGKGVGKVSPRLSCCGLQEQAQMGLGSSAQMFGGCSEGPIVPHLHPYYSGVRMKAEGSGPSNSRVPGPTSLGGRKETQCWGFQVSMWEPGAQGDSSVVVSYGRSRA